MRVQDYLTYPPVGRCIYCGAVNGPLSREHIVPYALGGNWILQKASCAECAKKTCQTESVCTNERYGMLYAWRNKHRMQSRSGWKGRENITLQVRKSDGSIEDRAFETKDAPAAMYGFVFPPAGIIEGREPSNTVDVVMKIRSSIPTKGFPQAGEAMKLTTGYPTAFVQMIAKIGYAFAAAETGTDDLLPGVADIILWREANVFHLIGGGLPASDGFVNDLSPAKLGHVLQLHELRTRGQYFMLASVRLFADHGMPTCHVVVRHRILHE